MVPQETIRKILNAGVQAPSGSNSQPWRFGVRGDVVTVFMIPEKDHPILNVQNRGTLMAIGALLENVVIAAAHYGVRAAVSILPDKKNPSIAATVSLAAGGGGAGGASGTEKLFRAIWQRATNRKEYSTKAIDETVKKDLMMVPAAVGARDVAFALTEDARAIKALAHAASANEVLLFGNEALHRLFFQEIVWTEKEEKEKRSGLYLKTMELKPPQAAALRFLFKRWPIMRFMNRLGMARNIAKGNAKGYARCGAYGAVLCDNNNGSFVRAGRVVERLWLIAAAAGLSFHLQTGVNFFYQRIAADGENIFSPKEIKMIRTHYGTIADVFGAKEKCVPALFRIGYGGEPSGRSSRKAPEVVFNKK